MIINELEEVIFVTAAMLKCSDADQVFKKFLDDFVGEDLKEQLNCLSGNLQRLEPESKLIENFQITEDEFAECLEKFPTTHFKEYQEKYEGILGPLDLFSCGAVTGADDFIKFIAKGALIKFGDGSEDLNVAEMKKLREYFNNITFTALNCITKRYEDDPAG